MIRKFTHPLYLISADSVLNEIDNLTHDLKLEHGKDDIIKYGDFISHFKMNEYFVKAITAPGSDFIKMIELPRDIFLLAPKIKNNKSVSFATPTYDDVKPTIIENANEYDQKLEQDFNIFNFKVLVILIGRGTVKEKARLLFELVNTHGSNTNHVPGHSKNEPAIIWSAARLRRAIEMMFLFSELLSKLIYI